MITGISLSETKEYISKYDKDEPKTVWVIGPIDADIFDMIGDESRLLQTTDTVRFGLKGFSNFSVNGQNIKYETESRTVGNTEYKVVAGSIMRIIPPLVRGELAAEILKLSKVSVEEIKN